MSTYSRLSDTTLNDTTKKTNAMLMLDPLGLEYQQKILEKQTDALVNPKKYIEDRNKAITKLKGKVYTAWTKAMDGYLTEKIPESMARKKADAFAHATWEARMVEINEDFPLKALGVATERQYGENAKEFGDSSSIKRTYARTQRAPKKAPKRAPKRK